MVRFSPDNRHSAVQLFREYKSDQLMRKGHFRKGYLIIRSCIHFFRKAVGSSDNQNNIPARIHIFFYKFCELFRTALSATLIKQNEKGGFINNLKNLFPFFSPQFSKTQVFCVTEIRNCDFAKLYIVQDSLVIIVDSLQQIGKSGFSGLNQCNLHKTKTNEFFVSCARFIALWQTFCNGYTNLAENS